MGACEIKCPHAYKDSTISEAAGQKKICLKKDECSGIYIDKSHAYYYQIQAKILSVGFNIVIFCCGLQKISFCNEFFPTCATTAFFSKCILPEIVGK